MDTKTIIEGLENCISNRCSSCEYWEIGNITTCRPLLMDALRKVRELRIYERMRRKGKLVILPCSAGSMVYEIYQPGAGEWGIDEHKIRFEDLEKVGKTVFLDRKEAMDMIKKMRVDSWQCRQGQGDDK